MGRPNRRLGRAPMMRLRRSWKRLKMYAKTQDDLLIQMFYSARRC